MQIVAQKLRIYDTSFRREHDGISTCWVAVQDGTVLGVGPLDGVFRSVSQIRRHFGDSARVSIHPQCLTKRDKKRRKKDS